VVKIDDDINREALPLRAKTRKIIIRCLNDFA
jgi:hypothetical protein